MSRLESGPVRCGDDWAGIFIRGDSAFHYALSIDGILEHIPDGPIEVSFAKHSLGELRDKLLSCREPCDATPISLGDTR